MPTLSDHHRPVNHVVGSGRDIQEHTELKSFPRLLIPGDLVDWLEEAYPNRCRGLYEDEWQHERYAGKVELVQELRTIFDNYAEFGEKALLEDQAEAAPATRTTTVELD